MDIMQLIEIAHAERAKLIKIERAFDRAPVGKRGELHRARMIARDCSREAHLNTLDAILRMG